MTKQITHDAHFVVEFSDLGGTYGSGKTYRVNRQMDVICGTAQRAIELTVENYPNADIHVVRRVGRNTLIIIDDGVT